LSHLEIYGKVNIAYEFDFNCYTDSYDCEDYYWFDENSIFSSLSTGKRARGSIAFLVPKYSKSVVIEYHYMSLWNDMHVEFVVY